jgi:uncharacterized phage protein gp47/JayE
VASFPTPSAIQTAYLQILKSIKPSLNINDQNSDFVIRGKAFSGLVSGLYGDQAKVDEDTYISSARPEALVLHGADLGISLQPATAASCTDVSVSGANGTVINPNDLTAIYGPTNVLYSNTTGGTIVGGVVILTFTCEVVGQIGNIASPDTLTIVSPPTGVGTTATLLSDMSDGADIETTDSYRARLLSREQQPPAGGNETDYPAFAFAADPSVRSAFIRRFGRGLGTVDVYITTGTTDIDTAVTQGDAIIRIPSPALLATVQAYYNAHVPLTDCPEVYAPTEVDVNVTLNVDLAAGLTLTSIPSSPIYNPLNLNVQQLIQREISRALYKNPVGGRVLPGGTVGYVVASDIEESIDTYLSAEVDTVTGLPIGFLPILADRQVQPLNGSQYNLPVTENQLAAPGTLTVVLGV